MFRFRNSFAFIAWNLTLAMATAQDPIVQPKPGPLTPAESIRAARVHQGFTLELVAAEPLVADPVAIDWGPDGRLWVAEMADYPYGSDGQGKPGGRVRFLEDTDGDGRYDRSTVFLDEVSFPTAVTPWRDGVLVTAAPELFFARDTDGDGRADVKEPLFQGFIEGNQQLRVNSLQYGLDHWIYCAAGGHHAGFGADTTIRAVKRDASIALGSRDFRIQPDTGDLEPRSGPTQFGRIRDDWGNWFGVQNSFPLWHYVLDDHYLRRNPHVRYPDVREQLRPPMQPRVFPAKPPEKRYHGFDHVGRYTSACGPSIDRDIKMFGESPLWHAFTCEPFHNVVQHHTLKESGVTFVGQRAETNEPLDFFASEDQWCRPVMTRTGPDGCLWIVDMYRYMIEHPDWLPPEGKEELRPFYRSGESMGRIYRIYPSDQPPARIAPIAQESDAQIAAHLASRNGVLRDWAQRLLIERKAVGTKDIIVSLATSHVEPRVRLQAYATLAGLGGLSDEMLISGAIKDSHPMVRRWAIEQSEKRQDHSEPIVAALASLVHDPSPVVRLQLALSLGEFHSALAGQALAELSLSTADDPFMNAAVLSSAVPHYRSLVSKLAEAKNAPAQLQQELLVLGSEFPNDLVELLHPLLTRSTDLPETRFHLAAEWLDGLQEEGKQPSDLAVQDPRWPSVLAALEEAKRSAWDVAFDRQASLEAREAALRLVKHDPTASDREPRLASLVSAQTPSQLQLTALQALGAAPQTDTLQSLLEHWPELLPEVRQKLSDQMMAPTKSAQLFLLNLAEGPIRPLDLDAARRERWLHHPDQAIATEAARLLQQESQEGRQAVIDRMRPAVSLTGHADRGETLFTKHCASCHLPREGSPIGPDLRSLTDRSPDSLLTSILDPSRAVEPKYLGYHAELKSGELVYGVVVSESGTTLRLRQLDGVQRDLVREHLESLTSSQRSFMPEGFENELGPQDLADIMRFVQELK